MAAVTSETTGMRTKSVGFCCEKPRQPEGNTSVIFLIPAGHVASCRKSIMAPKSYHNGRNVVRLGKRAKNTVMLTEYIDKLSHVDNAYAYSVLGPRLRESAFV